MSFRKRAKDDNPTPEEKQAVQQAKQQISDAAQDVTKAAEKFNGIPLNRFITKDELKRMKEDVDGMDDLFKNQEQEMLKDIEVRVMKYDPSGRLTDVTDRVRPGDIHPDNIARIKADAGVPIQRDADGKLSQEGALDLLTALLGGSRGRRAPAYFDERLAKLQLNEMEAAINEAERILEHWKK